MKGFCKVDYNRQMPETAESSAPDWDAIAHEVLCPLCEYNLRGLSEARCPECGYRFEWDVITDPAARPHPFAFENHPERNVRSFFRTLWGTLTPTRFWKSLSPTQPSRGGRLAGYAVICSVFTLMVVVGFWYWAAASEWRYTEQRLSRLSTYQRFSYGAGSPTNLPPTPLIVQMSAVEKWRSACEMWSYRPDLRGLLVLSVLWLIWPWMTLLSLAVFQISMQRAKIKTIHVARSIFYSFDAGAWLGMIVVMAGAVSLLRPFSDAMPEEGFVLVVFFALLSVAFYRMWRAYRLYLKFDHAFLTVLSAAVMTFLLGLIIYLDFERDFIRR